MLSQKSREAGAVISEKSKVAGAIISEKSKAGIAVVSEKSTQLKEKIIQQELGKKIKGFFNKKQD